MKINQKNASILLSFVIVLLFSTSIFDNTNHPTLYLVLMIVGIIGAVLIGVAIVIFGIYVSRNTYPAGTLYSTVSKKDFRRKREKK